MASPEDGGLARESGPELSVIIASYNSLHTVDACLSSLQRQATPRPFEIVFVDSSTDGTAEHVRRRYPEVRLLTSSRRLYCGDARNLALGIARAPLIAFLDADCYVEANWVEALLAAHRSPHLLVGGAIENASRNSLIAWAYYFCEFSLWLPRATPGETGEIAGCCLSFKREAFEKYGPFLCGTYCSDTAFQWRARRDGHRVLASPTIRVFHTWHGGLGAFLSHVVEHRRAFIRVARSQEKINRFQRWVLLAFSPLYPLLLLALTAGRVLGSSRCLPHWLRSLPLVCLGCCARAWGEAAGLLERPTAPQA